MSLLSTARGAFYAVLVGLWLFADLIMAQETWPPPGSDPYLGNPYPSYPTLHDPNYLTLPDPNSQSQFPPANTAEFITALPPTDASFPLDASANPATIDSLAADPLGWAITFGWLTPSGQSGFGMADFDAHYSWQRCVDGHENPVVLTPGFGFHLWSGPQQLDLPPRVYDLYVDMSWRFLERGWWGLAAGITPGLYGDFERFDGRTFQLTGWLLGDWALNECWTVVGGIAYVRQLRSSLLPVGGLIWRPTPDSRFDLVVPRARMAWRTGSDGDHEAWGYLSAYLGGGSWAVDDGPANVLVQYSDMRLAVGIERSGPSHFAMLEAGLAFARDIALNDTVVFSPGSSFFLQGGVEF